MHHLFSSVVIIILFFISLYLKNFWLYFNTDGWGTNVQVGTEPGAMSCYSAMLSRNPGNGQNIALKKADMQT